MDLNSEQINQSRRHFFAQSFSVASTATWLSSSAMGQASDIKNRPSTLGAFLDTLIPSDETASATEAGILNPYLEWLDDDSFFKEVSFQVSNWLNEEALLISEKTFTLLEEVSRIRLLTELETLPIYTVGRTFFDSSRNQAFSLYYSRQESWQSLVLSRPPQPIGYLKYYEAITLDKSRG